MNRTKSVQINIRLPDEAASALDRLARQEKESRASLARELLLEGLANRKQAAALRLYREGKATKSRAAEIAGISLWEMMDLLDREGVPASYSLQEAVEDVRQLVANIPGR